jgi:hypothetical protein
MSYTILILESVRNEAAARRELLLKDAAQFQGNRFDHVYAAEWAPLDQTQPIHMRSLQKGLDEHDLLRRINESIERCAPDILLVQSGATFHNYPEQMWFVLQALKAAHPQLRIGFHPRPFEQHRPKPFIEYTSEMGELMAQVFAESHQES